MALSRYWPFGLVILVILLLLVGSFLLRGNGDSFLSSFPVLQNGAVVPTPMTRNSIQTAKKLSLQKMSQGDQIPTYIVEGVLLDDPTTDQWDSLVGTMSIVGDSEKTPMHYVIPKRDGKVTSADLGGIKEVWDKKPFEDLKKRLRSGMKLQFRITPTGDVVAQKGLAMLFATEIINPKAFNFIPDMVGVY